MTRAQREALLATVQERLTECFLDLNRLPHDDIGIDVVDQAQDALALASRLLREYASRQRHPAANARDN